MGRLAVRRMSFRAACWSRIVLAAAFSLAAGTPAHAVIIFEKGKAEPVRGFLVSQDATRVVIRAVLPGGGTQERTVPRANIEDLIQAVSAERLAALRREQPQGYRDYAEELAEKREDPEARQEALRLFLIAAHLDAEKLGRSSLLGMVSLARTPVEERRFRAMAFLLDPAHDRAVLREPDPGGAGLDKLSPEDRKQLGRMLSSLREGRADDARLMAQRDSARAWMDGIVAFLRPEDIAGLRPGATLPPPILRRVLSLELALAGAPRVPATARTTDGWSRERDATATAPIRELNFSTLTEFNPTHCHYRNGKWEP